MKNRTKLVGATVLVLGAALVGVGLPRPPLVYYRSTAAVEGYLQRRTPLGSPLADVQAFLNRHAKNPGTFVPTTVRPGGDYPLSEAEGNGFIHATIRDYRIFFVSSVEAFYVFGAKAELVSIRVRKTVDAF